MKAFLVSLDAVTGDVRGWGTTTRSGFWCELTRDEFRARVEAVDEQDAIQQAQHLRLEVWGWQARVTEGGAL